MEAFKETRALSEIDADVLIVAIFQDEKVDATLKSLDEALPEAFVAGIAQECEREKFTGKNGQTMNVPTFGNLAVRKLVLRGLGKATELDAAAVRKAAAASRRGNQNAEVVALNFRTEDPALLQAEIEGWTLGAYKFLKYKTKEDDKKYTPTRELRVVAPAVADDQFAALAKRAKAIAEATNFARDLIAEPAVFMTPTKLAEAAMELNGNQFVTVDVLEMKDVEKLGMGSFLGVARGAKEPAKFIVMRYMHPNAKQTVGLAGKGITFDSGGLSIKTSQGMENMKYDMSGAAVVIATMRALKELQAPVNVVAVAAATENMPGENAIHPGDVLTAMNGKTIEVNNTDAEGRLVLADALSYLSREKPDEMIDLATLTGAVVTALGRAAAGIMGNNDALVERIRAAGDRAGERYWQLPMYDEYKEALKSDIADLKNAGARGEAPTAAAAMFLKEFVDGVPWVHLDIAGPAWMDKEKDELNKGGTAFGVRTLCYYLLSLAES
jgi:leucyl aminopeptidase